MYEDLSPGSTATTLNDGSENRAFPLDLNLPPHHTHTPTTTTSARDERVYLSPAHTHISPTHSHHVAAVAHSHVSPVTHYGLGINVNVNLNGVNALSAAAATVEFNSKLWWDNLLNQYSPNREQSYVSFDTHSPPSFPSPSRLSILPSESLFLFFFIFPSFSFSYDYSCSSRCRSRLVLPARARSSTVKERPALQRG